MDVPVEFLGIEGCEAPFCADVEGVCGVGEDCFGGKEGCAVYWLRGGLEGVVPEGALYEGNCGHGMWRRVGGQGEVEVCCGGVAVVALSLLGVLDGVWITRLLLHISISYSFGAS